MFDSGVQLTAGYCAASIQINTPHGAMSGKLHTQMYKSVGATSEPLTPTSPLVHPDSLQTSLTLGLIYSKHMRQVIFLAHWYKKHDPLPLGGFGKYTKPVL